MGEERAVHGLSESFEKINNDGMKLDDETKTRRIKMRSFDLNVNESSKMKPLSKAKSLSSHFVVNLDELNVQASLRSNEETELLSIYESDSDHPTRLTESRSDAADEGESESDSCRWKVEMEPAFGISLKFEDVHYSVRTKGSESSAVEKCILKEVSGSVHPGEVLALMGPSGGGKTTLLNLLSGRVRSNGGIITYNDRLYTKSLKRRIGFVMQDDTVFPHLTVKETLTYSALLRLPNTLSEQQKKDRAMDVLSQLGLERCQNTMVGGDFVRGVSGGERKRVCIGNEVLLNPSLLFLDEPTSGLDSTTALHIIQMLRDIAQAGRTVVTTIHQPSSRKFSKFDKLILLSSGSSLYFGKASEAMEYFSSLGCFPLIAMNPAEFLVDLACGNMKEKSVPSELEHTGISPGEVHKYLLGAYESRNSKMEKIKVNKLAMFEDKFEKQNMCDAEECGASWSAQFCILFKRGLKERRHEYFSSVRVIQVVSTSVIAGLIWWKPDASSASMTQDQAGLLFFISVYWAFFPVFTAIHTFPLERAMLAKERSVGMYKLSAYLLARNASDLPLDLTLPVIFLMIIYFMVGLKPTFYAFSSTLLSIFLSIIAAQGLGLAIGAAVMDMKKATALASVTVMAAMLAGGFFINKVPPFMSWIRNVSLNYHTYKLLLKIQCSCNGKESGSEICNLAFVKARERERSGTEVGAMVVMIVGYRLLTYISLRRMKLRAKA